MEAASMTRQHKKRKHTAGKTVLRLPDLEQSRNAVLNSLAAASWQESYGHAINEFIMGRLVKLAEAGALSSGIILPPCVRLLGAGEGMGQGCAVAWAGGGIMIT
jgi:hypothetical protein